MRIPDSVYVKLLLMVNASPWGCSRSSLALRFLRASLEAGHEVLAVFFREDGIYTGLAGRQADRGADDLEAAYRSLAEAHGFELLLCSASSQRRLAAEHVPSAPWREAGLGELMALEPAADRWVTF